MSLSGVTGLERCVMDKGTSTHYPRYHIQGKGEVMCL